MNPSRPRMILLEQNIISKMLLTLTLFLYTDLKYSNEIIILLFPSIYFHWNRLITYNTYVYSAHNFDKISKLCIDTASSCLTHTQFLPSFSNSIHRVQLSPSKHISPQIAPTISNIMRTKQSLP